jgi:UDPglucose 6-dehydrogenase
MVVIGTDSQKAVERVKALYDNIHVPEKNYVVTDAQSAEMIKYGVNAYLAIKLSFINEMGLLCENVGANISDVVEGLSRDRRIGAGYLDVGPGFGGADLPKDTQALVETARVYGEQFMVLQGAIDANEKQQRKMVEKIKRTMRKVDGKTFAVLGLSYKAETHDYRAAPAVNIIKRLLGEGAGEIRIYEPEGMNDAKWRFSNEKEQTVFCVNPYEAVEGADAIVLLTDWREFKAMDFEKVRGLMVDNFFFDLRNMFVEGAPEGFHYTGLGIAGK